MVKDLLEGGSWNSGKIGLVFGEVPGNRVLVSIRDYHFERNMLVRVATEKQKISIVALYHNQF
ncbi:hypothetical protein AXF42_Ash002133 [Apostasia shenzhenica]|uniref:Uncharacterized protein n=1 Tax=Apostasia shenzhenica TaxID=1088818 RepID=A0A2I0AMP0_9ASPA|nr:hypothetical protein AXF42_Ash002133 [Apostasia shenzhenica]